MDAFESCYPFCERKYDPFYVKKNLKAFAKKPQGKATRGKAGADYIVVKSDCGKSRRHTRASQSEEGLAYDVPYSMNRKYRFQTMLPAEIILDTEEESKGVVVHEQLISDLQAKNTMKSSYYKADGSSLPRKFGFDVLGNINTLNAQQVTKTRESKRQKKQKNSRSEEKENDQEGDVTLYTISQCPAAPSQRRNHGCGRKTRIRKRIQGSDFACDEADFLWDGESIEVDAVDEWVTQTGPRREFPLEEFIHKPSKKQKIDIAIEKQYEIVEQEEPLASSAFKVVDLPKEILNWFQFAMTFRTRRWKEFDFATEAERVSGTLSENCEFSWLSDSHKAFAISIYGPSKFVKQNSRLFPVFNIIFEMGSLYTIKIRYEGNFKSDYPTRSIRSSLFGKQISTLGRLVEFCVNQFHHWNTHADFSEYMSALDDCAADRVTLTDYWTQPEYDSRQMPSAFCSNLAAVNDEELLEMLSKKCAEAAKESDDFEIIECSQASCSVCGMATPSGMSALNCFHSVCIQCIREHVFSQFRADLSPIRCPVTSCTSVVPLTLLKCLLPIPFFIYYVRRSYKHMKQEEDRLTTCCPGCLRIGTVPKEISFKTLRCTKCNICFCTKCNSPPHWPLSCDEAAFWIKKFKLSEKFVMLRRDGSLKKEMIVRECNICSQETEVPDGCDSFACGTYGCRIRGAGTFETATGNFKFFDHISVYINFRILEDKDVHAKLVRRYCPTYFVQMAYCKKWMDAKAERFLEVPYAQIAPSATPQDRLPMSVVRECKKVACYLLQYGWVWLYMHRNDEDGGSWKEVQASLRKLEKTWDNVKEKFQIDTLTELNSRELQKLISDFDRIVQLLIALF